MVVNKLQLGLQLVAIKLPLLQQEDFLEDLHAFTGAKILGDQYCHESQVSKADPPFVLGKISGAKITKDRTILKPSEGREEEI